MRLAALPCRCSELHHHSALRCVALRAERLLPTLPPPTGISLFFFFSLFPLKRMQIFILVSQLNRKRGEGTHPPPMPFPESL